MFPRSRWMRRQRLTFTPPRAADNPQANCGLDVYWDAIRVLNPKECQALLLHAYHGEYALPDLLERYASVSLADMAQAMGMTESELAEIWNSLPWKDRQIEVWMGACANYPARLRMKALGKIAEFLKANA